MSDIRKCDICHRENEVDVYSSSLGAVSFAYCKECSRYNAEQKSIIVGTIEMLEGDVAEWVTNLNYYEDGEYKSAKILKEDYDKGIRHFDFNDIGE